MLHSGVEGRRLSRRRSQGGNRARCSVVYLGGVRVKSKSIVSIYRLPATPRMSIQNS